MEIGIAAVISAVVGSISFLVRNIFDNLLSGLWIRASGEVEEGDILRLKTEFGEKEGTVKSIFLRNVEIKLDNGEELLIEASKVLDNDVIRTR